MPEQGLEGIAHFLYEMGALKRLPRSGWLIAGVAAPESIAEHSFRTAILGWLLAHMEGADPARTALLCLFHASRPAGGGRFRQVTPRRQRGGCVELLNRAVRLLVGSRSAETAVTIRGTGWSLTICLVGPARMRPPARGGPTLAACWTTTPSRAGSTA